MKKNRKKRNLFSFVIILLLNTGIVIFLIFISLHGKQGNVTTLQSHTIQKMTSFSKEAIIPTSPELLPIDNININNPLFIGDSLTAGRGASSNGNSFPEQTLQMLNVTNLQSKNIIGRAGYTVSYMFNTIDPSRNAQNADFIVLELGTNDMLDKASGYSQNAHLANFEDAYSGMLNDLRTTAPKATIVCMSIWWDTASTAPSGLHLDQIDSIIQNQCTAFNGTYVDITSIYTDPLSHTAGIDWFHPNDHGHEKIAEAILYALARNRKLLHVN